MQDISTLSDQELVQLVRDSDQELYAHIVNRYQNKLMRYSTYLIGDSDKAQDAVQTTFIKAFQNLQSFNTDKKFSSWIYRICHNESINIAKKYQKETQLESTHWQNIQDDIDIEAELNRKQIKAMLHQNLNQLPPKYKSVLTLYYLEDKSYTEISDILRIPTGTVGTNLNRGKAMLKQIYESEDQHE